MRREEIRHAEVEFKAAERMDRLEKEKRKMEESAEERALALRETVERDRLGYAAVIAQRDEFEALVKRLKGRVAEGEDKLDGMMKSWEVEKRGLEREKERVERRAKGLEEELEFLRLHLDNKDSDNDGDRLVMEVKRLRGLIVDFERSEGRMLEELEKTKKNLRQLEGEAQLGSDTKERLITVEAELVELRKEKKEALAIVQHTKALLREREEIITLVKGLSPRGDVQEGLRLLREADGTFASYKKRNAAGDNAVAGQRVDTEQHRKIIAEMAKQEKEVQARLRGELDRLRVELVEAQKVLVKTTAERDECIAHNKRKERVRRILELEKACFKEALEKIEIDFDKPTDPDGSLKRLQERCAAYEKASKEYEATVAAMELSLREKEAAVKQLKVELSAATVARKVSTIDASADSPLRVKLTEAMQAAKDAMDAKRIADEAAQQVSKRLADAEEELRNLKLSQCPTDSYEEGDIDFNPTEMKVLHLKENPFSKAVQVAQAELDKTKGKKRLRTAIEPATSPARVGSDSSQIERLEKEVKDLITKNADLTKSSKVGIRTGEIAKKKIEEVRAAVYNLFGWSMKVSGAKYTIASIYAESPDDFLEFGVSEAGTMTLQETEYTTRLAGEIEVYVQKMNSLPALLANITVENFEKTTAFC